MARTIAGGKYRLATVIATGSFGKVYEDPPFAIKEIRLPSRGNKKQGVATIIAN